MSERRWTHKPPRVAVTGGIGSGKSTALAFLGELGAAVLSSDDVVHRIYTDPAIQDALRRRFGMGVVDGTRVNRAMLGRLVFEDREALDWLEQLTHPHVRRVVEEWALAHEHVPQPPELLAVEVPLLFESGLMIEEFDCVLLITAPRDVRLERVAAKLTPEEFERRATRQLSEAEKADRSDFVFENTGSRRRMREFIAETYAAILSAAAAGDEERVRV
jgi:dephospho-CoA kinase